MIYGSKNKVNVASKFRENKEIQSRKWGRSGWKEVCF